MGNTNKAWNCSKCHATNVTTRCGCESTPSIAVDIDSIQLVIPVRKPRRISL